MSRGPLLTAALSVSAAVCLFVWRAAEALPGIWPRALFAPDPAEMAQILLHEADFPRLAAALLAGALLALSGELLQRLLANPLAEAGTMGVFAGAQAALTGATIWAPHLAAAFRPLIAFGGAATAFAAVLLLALRQGLSSGALLLAGLILGLGLGGAASVMTLFHHEVLSSVFLWQAGSLVQDGWGAAGWLALTLGGVLLLGGAFRRPLRLLQAGEEVARSQGLAVGLWRAAIAALAVGAAAMVAAQVGVLGFVGLLAPLLTRLTGARNPGLGLVAGMGAGLLALSDQMVLLLQPLIALQTGSFFALIGGFALVILLPRLKAAPEEIREILPPASGLKIAPGLATAVLLALLWAALCLGRTPEGWSLAFAEMLPWRLPRVLAAIAAGAAFGLAGVLLQRAMANPMAGPEILGVSGGAALGLILAVALGGATGRAELFLATSAGAGLALAALIGLMARSGFSPRRLLLLGLGVATLISALLSGLLASGHPLAGRLLIWLAGSTDRATLEDALLALGLTASLLALTPFLRRWLEILPLGPETARALGVDLRRAQLAVMAMAAAATAVGTLLIGPLGFVGLLAPHLARAAGFRRAGAHLLGSAGAGAAMLLLADWLGGILAYPWRIPAGQISLFLGGLILALSLSARPR